MRITKYAAIDIGSNALRLLISNVIEHKKETITLKNSLVRVPIRLGQDAFTTGIISRNNIKQLSRSMKSFKNLMKVHDVKNYLAFATAALREAKNGKYVIDRVKIKSGINIQIIDGKKEARIISNSNVFDGIDPNKTILYVDVGGGSTELSIIKNKKTLKSTSFKIGTVRLLNDGVDNETWIMAKKWVITNTKPFTNIFLLGTGGNINKLYKISNNNENKPLTYRKLRKIYKNLNSLSYEERIIKFALNQDRSDVIIPATELFLKIFEWSGAKEVYVPRVGLSDGMIKELYKKLN
ncbi:MAG: exopolyphosphatase [Bacteroidota bacterium]|nr:exopolyphosphatase [Bacteroidota bacterium]